MPVKVVSLVIFLDNDATYVIKDNNGGVGIRLNRYVQHIQVLGKFIIEGIIIKHVHIYKHTNILNRFVRSYRTSIGKAFSFWESLILILGVSLQNQ